MDQSGAAGTVPDMRSIAYENPEFTIRVVERRTCTEDGAPHQHSLRVDVTGQWDDQTKITIGQVPRGFFDQIEHACYVRRWSESIPRVLDSERLAKFLRTQIPGAGTTVLFDYTSDPADPSPVVPDLLLLSRYESWECSCSAT